MQTLEHIKTLLIILLYHYYSREVFQEADHACLNMQKVTDKLQKTSLATSTSKDTQHPTIRLYLCTWNVGGEGPPDDLVDLLNLKEKRLPDFYAIGFQELDPRDNDMKDNKWTVKLTDVLAERDFVRLKCVRMQAISLQLFVKRELLQHVTSIESEYSKAGMGGWWGNKGGVSIRFDVGGVNLIIVNTHLAAHLENMAERIEDFNIVLKSQRFRDPDVENILDHDYIFWMGDLNCRLDGISKDETIEAIERNNLEKLLKRDQLKRAQQEELILVDFKEGPINFKPTYKFDKGTDIYDTSEKQRVPAWCDRILYKAHTDIPGLGVKQRKYDSPAYNKGDHKPVTGSFEINIFTKEAYPFVKFTSIPNIKYGQPLPFHYTVRCGIDPDTSPWDWIALYKANFKHLDDYVTYVYGKNDAEKLGDKGVEKEIGGSFMEVPPGKYVLCYISKYKGWLRGMSNVFEVLP